jgi:hypothetical protein
MFKNLFYSHKFSNKILSTSLLIYERGYNPHNYVIFFNAKETRMSEFLDNSV